MTKRGYVYSQILIFLFFLYIYSCMPLMIDDIFRSQMNALYNHTIITNVIDDYFTYSGRVSSRFLELFFFNKHIPILIVVADIISALSFNFLIASIYKIITREKEIVFNKQYCTYLAIFFFIFSFSAFIGTTMWKMVAIEYFWGLSLATYVAYKLLSTKKINLLLAIITGIFIGLYNEQVFALCFILLLVYIIYEYKISKKVQINILIMFILLFIFGMISLFAPGNGYRAQGEIMKFGSNIYIDEVIVIFLAIFRSILVLPFTVWAYRSTTKQASLTKEQKIAIKAVLILTLLASFVFFRYAGTGRVYMIFIILYFCVICYNTSMIDKVLNSKKLKKIAYTMSIGAIVLLIFGSTSIHYQFKERMSYINKHQNQSVCLKQIYSPVGYLIYFKDFNAYGNKKGKYDYRNYNKDYANYYHLKKIWYCN